MMEEFLFTFKKVVSIYLNPVTIGLEIIVIGIVMMVFSRRKPKKEPKPWWRKIKRASGDLGIFMVVFGCFFLYMCSIKPVSDSLVYALEKRYPPLTGVDDPGFARRFDPQPLHIVVLAGGARYHEQKSPTSQLAPPSMARVLEGVRLHQKFPDTSFIVTGRPAETKGMAELAETFGVPVGKIIQESESRDTKDHPKYLETLLQRDPFILVTSASHMPRSLALFRSQGYRPIAAPCDYWAWPTFTAFDFNNPDLFVPRVFNLYKTDIAFHEYMGMAWASLRKQTKAPEVVPNVEAGEGESETEIKPSDLEGPTMEL